VGAFAVGDVVLVPFPYTNLEIVKKRPALVAGRASFGDVILCQITSRPFSSSMAIAIQPAAVSGDGLGRESYARPDKLFTADPAIALRKLGRLDEELTRRVRVAIATIFIDD
jgi:mRNA interferase MazF